MIFDGNISVVLILLLTICLALLIISYKIIWELIIPSIENRKVKIFFKTWTFRSQVLLWSILILYFLYRFFISFPIFTIIILTISLLLGWSFWKDLLGGLMLKIERKFDVGDHISLKDFEGKVIKMGARNIELENRNNEKIVIWYHQLSKNTFGITDLMKKEKFNLIRLKKQDVIDLGGEDVVLSIFTQNPWSSNLHLPQLEATEDGYLIFKVWTNHPNDKEKLEKHFQQFIQSKAIKKTKNRG